MKLNLEVADELDWILVRLSCLNEVLLSSKDNIGMSGDKELTKFLNVCDLVSDEQLLIVDKLYRCSDKLTQIPVEQ